jgi:cell fate regulator YaaT (PSP1 superfamily)
MNKIGEFRNKSRIKVRPGTKVVVRSNRGVELGQVVCVISDDEVETTCLRAMFRGTLSRFLDNYENSNTFLRGGRILRAANEQDLIDYRHLEQTASEAGKFCREKIRELKLPMRLVKVEHLLGGEKIIFHFTAESRVDFRELVRQLASRFRTRIEMHQVGARDEARLVADYERCGRPCCCRSFLKELKPVSMKMAKIQKATLDPSKISGRCGRLMCCLRYEDDTYNELRKNLPAKNSWVRTEETIGRVLETQIITQLVRLMTTDGSIEVVGVEDIVEHNIPEPSREELETAAGDSDKKERKPRAEDKDKKRDKSEPQRESGQPEKKDKKDRKQEGADKKKPSGKKRRRRRRRRKKSSGDSRQESQGKEPK